MMEFVNGKDDIPYMKWKIKHVPNHQSNIFIAPVAKQLLSGLILQEIAMGSIPM